MTDDPLTSTAGSWQLLRDRLAALLERLALGEFVIVSTGEHAAVPGGYVQCKQMPRSLYCEAVSDVYLPEQYHLGDGGAAVLGPLGWESPGDGGNWLADIVGPDAPDIAARLLSTTLRAVYGALHPAELLVTPPEWSPMLAVAADWDGLIEQSPSGLDEAFAQLADTAGAWFGRNPQGIHTCEMYRTRMRVQLDHLGAAVAMHATAEVDSDIDPATALLDLDRIARAAGDYRILRTTGAQVETVTWLSTVQFLDDPDSALDDIALACRRLADASRWAAAVLEEG